MILYLFLQRLRYYLVSYRKTVGPPPSPTPSPLAQGRSPNLASDPSRLRPARLGARCRPQLVRRVRCGRTCVASSRVFDGYKDVTVTFHPRRVASLGLLIS